MPAAVGVTFGDEVRQPCPPGMFRVFAASVFATEGSARGDRQPKSHKLSGHFGYGSTTALQLSRSFVMGGAGPLQEND